MNLESVVANLVEQLERRFFGKYRGLVVDNADPEKLGRLKLRVPSVLGEVVTGWAMPCVPYGGDADQGFLFVPEIGAGVWVEFEEGDLEFPIWVGTYWSRPGGKSELPRPVGAGSVQDPPTRKILKTAAGHTIELEDKAGQEKITIRHKRNSFISIDRGGSVLIGNQKGSTLILNSKDENVVLVDEHGNSIQMTDEGITVVNMDGDAAVDLGPEMTRVMAKTIMLQGTLVAVGEGAMFPTIVVDPAFQAMWNAFMLHTHPTALGPSGPPLPPGPTLAPGAGLTSAVVVA